MTFTHMAVVITDEGGGQTSMNTTCVRGDDATEALADLLMGADVILPAGLIAVIVRRGIDMAWMEQPPVYAQPIAGWEFGVGGVDPDDVTFFSAKEAHDLLARLRPAHGAG